LKGAKIDLKALAAGQDCEFEINEKEDYLGLRLMQTCCWAIDSLIENY
jgi:hypothetical protein